MGEEQGRQRDTIFALATAPGRAGIAVVRVSGPDADASLQRLSCASLPVPRVATLRFLYGEDAGRIDQALVLRFEAPHSYTGEDVIELQTHGGPAVVAALLAALAGLPGLRQAEPGEFTRRAVLNGCLDLTQAEAIADLVAAETEAQRRQAQSQFEGKLGALYEEWRERLIRAAAWVEASIDFADEEIPESAMADSRVALKSIADEMRAHLDDGRRGERLRDGLRVAIIGPPNAGKSSLLNALAQREVAIVSPIPGTTRDVIEVRLDLGGYPVVLADTAGLRESPDTIEKEGVRRALAQAEAADLRLFVLDAAAEFPAPLTWELVQGNGWGASLTLWNKADLMADRSRSGLWVSAKTGEGLQALVAALSEHAATGLVTGDAPVITRARYREAIEQAVERIHAAIATTEPELAAEHLRRALHQLGRITGRVDLEELLDVIFRDFCIGK